VAHRPALVVSDFVVGLDLGQAGDYTAAAVVRCGRPAPLYDVGDLDAPDLVVDYTGVGRPVVDMVRAAGLDPKPVTITGGDNVTIEGGAWRVPKRDLIGGAQVLMQGAKLRIARALALAPVLADELVSYRVRIDPLTAHDSYGAWRDGQHDDLVLALCLAVWWAERERRKPAPRFLRSYSY
jgi:hypothetical protein